MQSEQGHTAEDIYCYRKFLSFVRDDLQPQFALDKPHLDPHDLEKLEVLEFEVAVMADVLESKAKHAVQALAAKESSTVSEPTQLTDES